MLAAHVLEKLSIEMLKKAIKEKIRLAALAPLTEKRTRLLAALKKIEGRIERLTGSAPVKKVQPKKRKLSAAGRKRIVAAAKARWAKVKAEKKEMGA